MQWDTQPPSLMKSVISHETPFILLTNDSPCVCVHVMSAAFSAFFSLEEVADQAITLSNFITLCEIHDALLFPATLLQAKLKDLFMCIDYWYDSYELRCSVTKGKYVSMETVLRRLHRRAQDIDLDRGDHRLVSEGQLPDLSLPIGESIDGEEDCASHAVSKKYVDLSYAAMNETQCALIRCVIVAEIDSHRELVLRRKERQLKRASSESPPRSPLIYVVFNCAPLLNMESTLQPSHVLYAGIIRISTFTR